jgi:hypothetical protein
MPLYNMPRGWKLTDEETLYLSHLSFSISPAIPHMKWKPSAKVVSAGRAAVAEIEQFTVEEILHALRTTHGAKPDPTRRLELLHDERGNLPETVTQSKACKYARVTDRQMRRLVAEGRIRFKGGQGNRHYLVADLIDNWPPEK